MKTNLTRRSKSHWETLVYEGRTLNECNSSRTTQHFPQSQRVSDSSVPDYSRYTSSTSIDNAQLLGICRTRDTWSRGRTWENGVKEVSDLKSRWKSGGCNRSPKIRCSVSENDHRKEHLCGPYRISVTPITPVEQVGGDLATANLTGTRMHEATETYTSWDANLMSTNG